MKNAEISVTELLSELEAEELEPRLELQVLVDPLAAFCDSRAENNCRDNGTCNIEAEGS
jgi:hypothetical protein